MRNTRLILLVALFLGILIIESCTRNDITLLSGQWHLASRVADDFTINDSSALDYYVATGLETQAALVLSQQLEKTDTSFSVQTLILNDNNTYSATLANDSSVSGTFEFIADQLILKHQTTADTFAIRKLLENELALSFQTQRITDLSGNGLNDTLEWQWRVNFLKR